MFKIIIIGDSGKIIHDLMHIRNRYRKILCIEKASWEWVQGGSWCDCRRRIRVIFGESTR